MLTVWRRGFAARPYRGPTPPKKSSGPLVFGLVAFTALMGAVPLILHKRMQKLQGGTPLWASEAPLGSGETRRGVYLNTGSKDVGADPDWDHANYLYKGRPPAVIDESTGLSAAGSASMRAQQRGTSLGPRT